MRERIFNYMMPVDPQFRTRLVKREGKGIWQGLFEFPLIETQQEVSDREIRDLLKTARFSDLGALGSVVRFNQKPLVHKLSHQHLRVTFWILHLEEPLDSSIPVSEMQSYPVPVVIANFMETVKNSYF